MTDLVSLLFIAMIPIDCKITNFPYTCNNMGGVHVIQISDDIYVARYWWYVKVKSFF